MLKKIIFTLSLLLLINTAIGQNEEKITSYSRYVFSETKTLAFTERFPEDSGFFCFTITSRLKNSSNNFCFLLSICPKLTGDPLKDSPYVYMSISLSKTNADSLVKNINLLTEDAKHNLSVIPYLVLTETKAFLVVNYRFETRIKQAVTEHIQEIIIPIQMSHEGTVSGSHLLQISEKDFVEKIEDMTPIIETQSDDFSRISLSANFSNSVEFMNVIQEKLLPPSFVKDIYYQNE